jgi:hypothetical protein
VSDIVTDSFSPEGYRALLSAGQASGYRFVTFGDIRQDDATPVEPLCLLRHDVDVNVRFALKLARIEAEAGVSSTYFLMLRSPAYNLLARATALAVREIVALGHEVGVHFDAQHPLVTDGNLIAMVLEEQRIIADVSGSPVHAVSFHQPSNLILQRSVAVPGLINTYNKQQLVSWHYVSDSNRDWRGQSCWELLRSGVHPRIQILTHPMWWVCRDEDVFAVWDAAMLDNLETMQQQFLDTERAYGNPRLFEISRDKSPAHA